MSQDDTESRTSNTVNGVVLGQLVQAEVIQGDVHYHQDSAAIRVVVAAEPAAGFGVGTRVVVGDRTYLVHDCMVGARFTPDGAEVLRQGRVAELGLRGALGWFRQVERRHGSGTAGAELAAEAALAQRLGVPEVVQFDVAEPVTLVTAWPRERSGRPVDSLLDRLHDEPVLDGRLHSLCHGLADLCADLRRLHETGCAHRALAPDGILVRDEGRWALRDLGLAVRPGRPGENAGEYQAPEQRRRVPMAPGPHTDVHQVAAITYRVLTARSPGPGNPLPVRAWAQSAPDVLATAVDAILAAEPGQRPDIHTFGGLLRRAGDAVR